MDTRGLVVITENRTEPTPERLVTTRSTRMSLNGRERRESDRSQVVVIEQPDLRRQVTIDHSGKAFTVRPIFGLATPAEMQLWQKQTAHQIRRKTFARGTYDIFIENTKLDETCQFLGYPARRYVTHRKTVRPPGAHSEGESVTDGWYLDFNHPALPEPSRIHRVAVVYTGNEVPTIHRSGEHYFSGLPAKVETSHRHVYLVSGSERTSTSKHTTEIISLTEDVLDPALFEPPSDYAERPVISKRWNQHKSWFYRFMRPARSV
jgi:hypothetical protein